MKKIILFATLISSILFFAKPVLAADLSSGDMVTIERQQKNPLIFSNNAKIKSDTKGDLTVFAGDVQVDNSVENSAFIFGGTINLKSPEIGNRLVIFAGDAKVSSHIKGDLIIFGGNVSLESPTIVDGDIYAYGGNLYLRGQALSGVKTGGGKVVLEGFLAQKDMSIYSDQILADETSNVKGNLKYYSKKPVDLPKTFSANPEHIQVNQSKTSGSASFIGGILMLMLLGFFVVWAQKDTLPRITVDAYKNLGTNLLTGFILSIAVPVAIIVLMLTYVGIMAAIALALLYAAAWIFGYIYGLILLGTIVLRWFRKTKGLDVSILSVVLGSIIVSIVGFVPFIGPLVVYLIALTGLGMTLQVLKGVK